MDKPPEIEVTPAMIEAGRGAVAMHLADTSDLTPQAELAAALGEVFRAMWGAVVVQEQDQIAQEKDEIAR